MQVRQCPLGCCNQQLLKSRNKNGLRISLPLHHFVSNSLQQGLYLYRLSHMAMVTFSYQLHVTASSTFPLGSQHHLRPSALLSWRQDREAWETKPCLLPVVQAEAGTHHWRGCGPARGCHNLPFMAFPRPLQVLSMGLLWAAARAYPVLPKWGACFWACL